jgi:hypothetical protein
VALGGAGSRRGNRIVGTDTELVEISAATTCACTGLAAAFCQYCRRTGRFDGAQASYYVRDR